VIVFLQYSYERSEKYYEDILRDYFRLTINEIDKLLKDIKLKVVLLTEDQQFGDKKVLGMLNKSVKEH
jgi:hypothetical protein